MLLLEVPEPFKTSKLQNKSFRALYQLFFLIQNTIKYKISALHLNKVLPQVKGQANNLQRSLLTNIGITTLWFLKKNILKGQDIKITINLFSKKFFCWRCSWWKPCWVRIHTKHFFPERKWLHIPSESLTSPIKAAKEPQTSDFKDCSNLYDLTAEPAFPWTNWTVRRGYVQHRAKIGLCVLE